MKSIKFCFSILLGVCVAASAFGQSKFKATNENIRVVGRSVTTSSGNIEFDWPGISILTNFEGTSISLLAEDTGRDFFNVYIDGIKTSVIEISGEQKVLLAENLADAPHSLRITKRTEGKQGKLIFKGLELEAGKTLLAPSPAAARKIEFVGNSITCGYGTEANSGEEDFKAETENCELSYAAFVADELSAEYHMIAHSGIGVAKNHGDSTNSSENTMTDRYKQVFDEAEQTLWDFTKWNPNAVVINLGTNDFFAEPHPNKAVFNKKYNELVAFIRTNYGDIPVFCIVGPIVDEPCYTYVKNMVDGNRNFLNDENIFFIGIPQPILSRKEDFGANWHPNHSGQEKIANYITPLVKTVLGW